MTTFPATMASVRELITIGEAVVGTVSTLAEPMQLGLWSQDSSTGRIMARTGLVQLAARLPNFDESVAAPFACQSKLRFSWFRIVAARLREAGKRRDTDELCNAIELLGEASRMIREAVPNVSLQPSFYLSSFKVKIIYSVECKSVTIFASFLIGHFHVINVFSFCS